MSKVDANSQYASMAVTDDAALTPSALLVDPITGRLMITIAIATAASTGASPEIDANSNECATAVTDDASATVKPWLTNDNGLLWMDVTVE